MKREGKAKESSIIQYSLTNPVISRSMSARLVKRGFGIYFLPLLRRFSSSNSASSCNLKLRCTLSPFVRCFGINRGQALFNLQGTCYQCQQNETQCLKCKHPHKIRNPLIISLLIPQMQWYKLENPLRLLDLQLTIRGRQCIMQRRRRRQRWYHLGFCIFHRTLNQSMHIRLAS